MASDDLELFLDAGMLELFRAEVGTHAMSLESGLLELEARPEDRSNIEPLMRAAHSIKGAARIVGLDAAVRLAHAMEDILSGALEGVSSIGPASIDALLQGVDLFKQLSQVEPGEITPWVRDHDSIFEAIENKLALFVSHMPEPPACPESAKEDEAAVEKPAPEEEPQGVVQSMAAPGQGASKLCNDATQGTSDSAILVTADNLSRLMALAGECLVESHALGGHVKGLYRMKAHLAELTRTLETIKTGSGSAGTYEENLHAWALALRQTSRCRDMLLRTIDEFEAYAIRWENLSDRLYNEAIAARMRPFKDGAHGFPRLVRDMAKKSGKRIDLRITGELTKVDRDILAKLEAPLTHLLRNACDHGIEFPEERAASGKPREGTITIEATHRAGMLSVIVRDDGRGIDLEQVRRRIVERGLVSESMARNLTESEVLEFLFLSGFTTAKSVTEVSGRGVGLDVVKSMVQEVRGTVKVYSQPGCGTTFQMELPLTLSVMHALMVEIGEEPYAFPLTRLDRVLRVSSDHIACVEERQYISFENENIGLVSASQPLGLSATIPESDDFPVLVISDRLNRYGVVVDRVIGEVELVVRPLDPRLGKVPNISAAAIEEDGSPVLIIDVDDLVRSIDNMLTRGRVAKVDGSGVGSPAAGLRRILVVDDSITVREVERRLLENRGYQVDVAVDGMDGWNAVREGKYDLVISDVDMPRMNGIEMVRHIRSDSAVKDLPVIILSYKDREEDRLLGLEVGADCYLTKSSFYDESFINAVTDLIGEP